MIFIPSKSDYIRIDQGKDFAFSEAQRLKMLRQIAEDHPWMIVSDHELKQDHQPRTYETLCDLKEEGYQVKLLFGSDKLCELQHGWLHIPELCREFGIAVMEREHEDIEQMIHDDPYLSSLKQYITIVHTPDTWQDISSSKVRKALLNHDLSSVMNMIPKELDDLYTYMEK